MKSKIRDYEEQNDIVITGLNDGEYILENFKTWEISKKS